MAHLEFVLQRLCHSRSPHYHYRPESNVINYYFIQTTMMNISPYCFLGMDDDECPGYLEHTVRISIQPNVLFHISANSF